MIRDSDASDFSSLVEIFWGEFCILYLTNFFQYGEMLSNAEECTESADDSV